MISGKIVGKSPEKIGLKPPFSGTNPLATLHWAPSSITGFSICPWATLVISDT
jgi:hypothetical protein